MSIKFLYGLIAILSGIVCYVIAKRSGQKHPSLWFAGGVLFNVFAIVLEVFIVRHFSRKMKGGVS